MFIRLAILATAATAFAQDQFIENPRQLILEGKRSGEGYFDSAGKRMIFQSEREEGNPFYQMYTLDLESGDTARISPGTGKTTCGFFTPDGLIFASTHEDPDSAAKQKAELDFRASGKQRRYAWDYDPSMDIFAAKADGSGAVNITKSPGYDAEGAVSPDGKLIVFCSLRGAYGRELNAEEKARLEKDPAWFGDIYVMNADGSNVRQLTNAPGYDGGPFFSPDGERIVWRRFDASGMNADVFTMKTDGTDVRQITDFKCMSWAPYYHPSGKYIIFTANKFGFENFELFIADAAGGRAPVRVTNTPGFDGLPVFSPDGKKLSWASGRTADAKSQIFLANWNHEAALAALAGGANNKAPASPAETAKPEITLDDLRDQVRHLAGEKFAGRATGSDGAREAANFIADYFQRAGLKPLPGRTDYFQEFEFSAGERVLADQSFFKLGDAAGKLDTDYRPLPFSSNERVEGELVFAGYGLSAPESAGQRRYSSFEGLDVKDKVVLLLRYVPESVEPARRAHLNRYSGLRYKVMMARERGAKAVLVVTGPNSPNAGELLPLSGDGSSSDSGLPALSISGEMAQRIFKLAGKDLKAIQNGLDEENPHIESTFTVPGVKVSFVAGIEHIKKTDRNVIACVPGETDEWVTLGAHYDHLGTGKGSNTLARSGEENRIHYGADDNASGTSALLEIAHQIATGPKPKRGVIFALWSGEEIGLLGSAAFANKPPLPLEKIAAYLNFDMVGRLRDNKLIMQATGSSTAWAKLLEKRNVAAGFALTVQLDPYLPTDVTSFYPKRIPVLNFFTGGHEDYHRPTDTAEKINYEGLERITKFAKAITLDVANSPERPPFSRVEKNDAGGGSRDNLRAYLGSIPDYAQEVTGVKLSGVRPGSPAEKAGIKNGDVIVEFAGQKIKNIYDYTYALDAVKIGQPVKITVQREGKPVELTATPEARK
jgi:Tol biopolymer transport system component